MNFENTNFEYTNHEHLNLSMIEKNAEEIIKRKKIDRFIEDSFEDTYETAEIESDKQYVLRIKEERNKNESEESKSSKKIADAIEIVINDQIEKSNWLSEETYTYQTSEYDDIKNGIDAVLEFIDKKNKENNQDFLGIAFDITYKNDVTDKFLRIRQEIDNNEKAQVKYFQSENTDYKGAVKNIPRLIIGLNINLGDELMQLQLKEGREANETLENHPFQFQLIDELLFQLDIFMEYSKKADNQDFYISYKKMKEKIEKIKKEKNIPPKGYESKYFYNFCSICKSAFN